MTEKSGYERALTIQKEVHGKYNIPDWLRNFLNDVSENSVIAQPKYLHDEQIANEVRVYSLMLDIGYSLGQTWQGQAAVVAGTVSALLAAGLKTLGPEETNKITKEILAIQKDVGEGELPEEKYVGWALSVLSPAIAALVVGNVTEFAKTLAAVMSAFYVIGRYDMTTEDVPEAFDFKGLDKILKGLEK